MEIDHFAMRSAFTTRALATMGADAEWDRRLADFLRADALQVADAAFGAYAAADEKHALGHYALKEKFGRDYRSAPGAVEGWNQLVADNAAAEEERGERYLTPLWQASRDLAMTPAPTLAAALFKVDLIDYQDLGNDVLMPRPPMDVVAEDFTRLAGEA